MRLLVAKIGRSGLVYGLVGIVVYALDFGTFALCLTLFPQQLLASNIFAKLIGALAGFVLHRTFTFPVGRNGNPARQMLAYSALLGSNILLSTALLWLLVDYFHGPALPARMLTDVIVIGIAFIGSRLVFERL